MDDPVFCITLDTDWAEPETLAEVLDDLLPECPVTIFVTGEYPCLAKRDLTELGIHPNYESGPLTEVFDRMMRVVPSAVGHRGHSLSYTERLRPCFAAHGTAYDSSFMLYLQPGIRSTPIARNVLQLPLYFMDMFHLQMQRGSPPEDIWNLKHVDFERPGLRIFDFHPVHLTLNTPVESYYSDRKSDYHNPKALRSHRHSGPGPRVFLKELIAEVRRRRLPLCLLRDVAAGEPLREA